MKTLRGLFYTNVINSNNLLSGRKNRNARKRAIDYRSLTGREQQKYAKKCAYELEQYKEYFAKVKALFPDSKIPTVELLRERQTKLREQYDKISAEYNFYKKEADRLARQIQQKRDSQKTIDRYLQNEQAAKRKKNQLE